MASFLVSSDGLKTWGVLWAVRHHLLDFNQHDPLLLGKEGGEWSRLMHRSPAIQPQTAAIVEINLKTSFQRRGAEKNSEGAKVSGDKGIHRSGKLVFLCVPLHPLRLCVEIPK